MKKLILLALLAFTKVDAQIITTVAGNGTGGYSGDGGQATAAMLYGPYAIAFDSAGNTYVSDCNNGRIRKITKTTGIISTVVGYGAAAFGGDGGNALSAAMHTPFGICFDYKGNLYIADSYNNRIRKVNTSGIITTFAGDGYQQHTGDGNPATMASLNNPMGVVADNLGNIYIADASNACIRKVDTLGVISTLPASVLGPNAITIDAAGNLYVSEGGAQRISKINTLGVVTRIAGNGTQGYSGDGGQATAAQLKYPNGVAVDALGNVYIADYGNYRIRKVNTLGIISTVAGDGIWGFSGDGGLATAAEINYPNGIAVDATGYLYIADQGQHIRLVDTNTCSSPLATYTLIQNAQPYTWDANPTYSYQVINAKWYWGDGTSTLGLYPSHTYSAAGRYNICVTAYSSCGDSISTCQNDSIYRLTQNTNNNMVYVNVINNNITTSTKQLFINNLVSVYPNPASTLINIELKTQNITQVSISIYNLLGECVYKQTTSLANNQINIAELNEGVYTIEITNANQKTVKRLVKQ